MTPEQLQHLTPEQREGAVNSCISCKSDTGITVGLIDSIINALHILSGRDMTPVEVYDAITDLRSHPLLGVLLRPQAEWRVVYRPKGNKNQNLHCQLLFKTESDARTCVEGGKVHGAALTYTWHGQVKEVGLQKREVGSTKWEVVEFSRPKSSDLMTASLDSDLYKLPDGTGRAQ